MKAISREDEQRAEEAYLEYGVLDALITACNLKPTICPVHERLKAAYVAHLRMMKREIAKGTLIPEHAQELEEIGQWAIDEPRTEKPELTG